MKNKSKIKIVVTLLILIIFCAFIVFTIYYFNMKNKLYSQSDNDLTTAEENILILSKTFPTKIIVYGSEIDFDKKLSVTYIDEISKDSLKFDNGFSYQYIVINDLDDEINISNKEWELIDKTIKSDKRCNFIYLGSKELYKIKNLEILSDITYFEDSDLSVGLFHQGDSLITCLGTYTTEMKNLVPVTDQILNTQAMSIKLSNE